MSFSVTEAALDTSRSRISYGFSLKAFNTLSTCEHHLIISLRETEPVTRVCSPPSPG